MKRTLSSKLFSIATEVMPGGVNSPVRAFRNVGGEPFFVRRAKGSRLEDVDGNHYIDYIGSWGPNILGHAPTSLTQAIHEAAKEGVSYGIPNPYEVELAKMIVDWVPSVEMVRMVNSGTEATMSCIRLARGATGRTKIVKFEGCYHGHSDSLLVAAGSGALTHGQPDSAGVPASFASETIVLPLNDREKFEQVFARFGEEIAAVIIEPYPANAGFILPQPGWLEALRMKTSEYGSLLIFDEVMTGFRLAKGGVQELVGITPDLTAMGKVIGGGLPVGAYGGAKNLMNLMAPNGDVYQAGTLSGNPLAMAAGLTQLRALSKGGTGSDGYARLDELGTYFSSGLKALLKEKGLPWQVNQQGSMFCLLMTEEKIINLESVMSADACAFKSFFWECLNQGVYFAPSPYETGFISLAHTEADLDETLMVVENALKKI